MPVGGRDIVREESMKDREKSMVLASFLGDSLALGPHWIYDTNAIVEKFGRVDSLIEPLPNSFHPTKKKGEFTHYGDQSFLLLESIAAKKGFDLSDFAARWQTLFKSYEGYIDQATRGTLSNFKAGLSPEEAGSPSNDLAGASRIAPLVFVYREDLEDLINSAISQTKMTHKDENTVKSAEYFARVAYLVLQGLSPVKALKEVSAQHFGGTAISAWVEHGLSSMNEDSIAAIKRFGQTCHTPDAFPGIIHLIAKYEKNFEEAMTQAVMAGGDSAARALVVGMVLGAHLGAESLPEKWLVDLKRRDQILQLLQSL